MVLLARLPPEQPPAPHIWCTPRDFARWLPPSSSEAWPLVLAKVPLPGSGREDTPHAAAAAVAAVVAAVVGCQDPLPKEVEPVSLAEFKSEMTTLIDKEVKESGCMLDDAARYLSELNYTMTVNEGVATLKRTQGKHR